MKDIIPNQSKRDHTVVWRDYFSKGKNLEAWQLGWQLDEKKEAKSQVSEKIFDFYVEKMARNIIFFYVDDGNFYGIHSELCPTPVFRFKKDETREYADEQLQGDTHDYSQGEILYMVPTDQKVWDVVRIAGKSLEEVLQRSYIVNIS